uniref:Uncharacterized protein n=1 Tax=Amphimedon queenslandica TaxID=400682 RepID=A0A1X7ULQ1_AMPQE
MTPSKNCTTVYYTPTINKNTTLPKVQEVTFAIEKRKASTKKVLFHIQECPFGFSLSHKSLSPFIEKYLSHYHCCKWWVTLKPFFDAYNGPYEDKHRIWTALLLLIRIIYAVVVVYFNEAQIAVLITIIAILLGVVATTKAGFSDPKMKLEVSYIFSYISVSLIVLVFLCIVIYRFTLMKIWKKIKSQVIMRMPQTARKILQRRKYLRSLKVPFVDDKHVVTHDMENMVIVELYDEDGDFVTRRRETLIREDLID